MDGARGTSADLVTARTVFKARRLSIHGGALAIAMALIVAACTGGSGEKITDGAADPGASQSPTPTPEPVNLQAAAAVWEGAAAVAGETDATAVNDLVTLLFESAPIVVVVDESVTDTSAAVAAAQTMAAPIVAAGPEGEASEILTDLGTEVALLADGAATVPRDVLALELTDTWHEDLRAELGPIIEPQPAETDAGLVYFDGKEANFPLSIATAEAAGFDVGFLDGTGLFTADIELTEVAQFALVSATPLEEDALDWQYAVLNKEKTLPGGGYSLFDGKRYVALYGSPGVPALGILGQQDLDGALELAQEYAGKYQDLTDDEVIPAFEIIATVASAGAGADGKYSNRLPVERLQPWVEAAGEAGFYVLLDLQPGRTDFLTQAKEYSRLLEMPHVGLALDPEWRLKDNQKHLAQIGSVPAAEINEVSEWLSGFVREHELPPKMLILHQFSLAMIKDRADVDVDRAEVAVVIHADGQGSQGAKNGTWKALHRDAPQVAGWGWKNFLKEDHPVLSPKETYLIEPAPELVTYQ
ncbi:MAG TPA: hypothetical protein VK030_03845 [Actinomycetales bacterium]|nr:hypothetical protein [Actinomycetales bacterium]